VMGASQEDFFQLDSTRDRLSDIHEPSQLPSWAIFSSSTRAQSLGLRPSLAVWSSGQSILQSQLLSLYLLSTQPNLT